MGTPVAFAMLLQSAYSIIDLAFVGELGSAAVAGLSISFQAFFVVLALGRTLATTALAEISQAYGGSRVDDARGLATSFAIVALLVGLVAMVAAYYSGPFYVDAFTEDPEVYAQGIAYFEVTALTFLFQLVMFVFGDTLRASGDFVTPVKFMVVSVLANVILDPILIFGAGPIEAMGIAGAAWATVISQVLAGALYVWRLSRKREGRAIYWARPVWATGFFRRILSVGVPAGVQFFLVSVMLGIVLQAVKSEGAAWTAAAGAGFRLFQQMFLPMIALGMAAAAIAGQNLGAGQSSRVRDNANTALRWAFYYAVGAALVLHFGRGIFGSIFAENPEELAVAELYFEWTAVGLINFPFVYIPMFILQSARRSFQPMAAAVLRILLLIALVSLLIPALSLPSEYVFGAVTITATFEAVVSYMLMRRFLAKLPPDRASAPP
ncbi:MAG: putative MATE family efflux protein [Myxococcota bacterium]